MTSNLGWACAEVRVSKWPSRRCQTEYGFSTQSPCQISSAVLPPKRRLGDLQPPSKDRNEHAGALQCHEVGRHALSLAPPGNIDYLQLKGNVFDPTLPSLRSQLSSKLGVGDNITFETPDGQQGGLNKGIWFLCDASNGVAKSAELVLKLVDCDRTEAERHRELANKYPYILDDESIAFPLMIFQCCGQGGARIYDLLVMRRAPGTDIASVMFAKCRAHRSNDLLPIMETVGASLADFHSRYGGLQHGDFQVSNVYYDEQTGAVTFVDLGQMGLPAVHTDLEHFVESLNLVCNLPGSYGERVFTDCSHSFEVGYMSVLAPKYNSCESPPLPFVRDHLGPQKLQLALASLDVKR